MNVHLTVQKTDNGSDAGRVGSAQAALFEFGHKESSNVGQIRQGCRGKGPRSAAERGGLKGAKFDPR